MSFKKTREYASNIVLTRDDLAKVLAAQDRAYTAMVNNQQEDYLASVLKPLGGMAFAAAFKNTPAKVAGVVYSAISLLNSAFENITKVAFRDILANGKASMHHLNTNWGASWKAVEVEFAFIEVSSTGKGTARFFQGNRANPKAGYMVKRVQTGAGWINL